jgi:hypothetical protein
MRHSSFFLRRVNSSPFILLPYDILEDITEHLSRRDLCSLMLASRECSSLAARSLYSAIPLISPLDHSNDLRPHLTLRRRQFSFLVAISQHPEYTRFIRRIAFEFIGQEDEPSDFNHPIPTELVWKTFAKCQGVVYIDIKAKQQNPVDAPRTGMFPNLRRARVSGTFSPQTLAQLLNTSTSIRALELSLGSSYDPSPLALRTPLSWTTQTPDTFEFIRGDFSKLRTLSIEVHNKAFLTSLDAFFHHVKDHVTLLILSFPPSDGDEGERWSGWLQKVLNGFSRLEELWLKGVRFDEELSQSLRKTGSCPELRSVKHLEIGKECLTVF